MILLLDHKPDSPITQSVMIAPLESENPSGSGENLEKFLFERDNELEVTEAMLKEANSCTDIEILLKRPPDTRIAQDVVEAAASN